MWTALGFGLCTFAGITALGGLGDAENSHQVVAMLVASGIAGLISGILLFILYPLEKRVDRTALRHRRLLRAYFVLVTAWMLLHGPLRIWAGAVGLGGSWAIGVAPSFFAGLAVAFASALAYGFRPLTASACGIGFSILAEMIQQWLPSYTFDLWDVAAGLVGAGFAVPLLARWPVPVHTEAAKHSKFIADAESRAATRDPSGSGNVRLVD